MVGSSELIRILGEIPFLFPALLNDHLVLLLAGGVLVVDVELGAGEHDHGAGFLPLQCNNVWDKCDISNYLIRYNTLSIWCILGSSLGFERV